MHNPLSKEARQVVLGSLMGDGYMKMGGRHACFQTCASESHLDYLEWKHEMLRALCPSEPKCYLNHLNGKEFPTYQLWTVRHSFFTRLRNAVYPKGVKTVQGRMLNLLDPLGLATWFMDDGQMVISGWRTNKKGERVARGRYIVFNIQGFRLDECDTIRRWFKERWDIRSRLQFDCSCRKKNSVKLCIGAVDAYHKLRPLVEPYVQQIPSMKHKLDFKYSYGHMPPEEWMHHYKPSHSAEQVVNSFMQREEIVGAAGNSG